MLGGVFDSWKLKVYYTQALSEYSVLRRRGFSDLDAKIHLLKLDLELNSSIGISSAIKQRVEELDVLGEIQFMVWFNASLKTKCPRIPIVKNINEFVRERSVLSDIAFHSGDWWVIKADLKDDSLPSEREFNDLGKELAERFLLA